MKILLLLAVLVAFAAPPSFAGEADSALGKAARAKVVKEADDSAAKNAVKAKAAAEIVTDEGESAAKKAAKLKVAKEIVE